MARFVTIKEALDSYLKEKAADTDVWYQPAYRNVCAFVGERLLTIWFEVHYSWLDEADEIRRLLEREAVYETLLNIADPVTTVLNWTPHGLKVLPKIESQGASTLPAVNPDVIDR